MYIKNIQVLDHIRGEAASFDFSYGVNLITSLENGQGKSSIIKSIMYALGFDVKKFPNGWNYQSYEYRITLDFNGSVHTVKRINSTKRGYFFIDDTKDALTTIEFSNWLQKQLGLSMKLPEKDGSLGIANTTALLVPFYLDQDSSWSGILYKNTSNALNMYDEAMTKILEYYLGISSKELLNLEEREERTKRELEPLKSRLKAFEGIDELKSIQDYTIDFGFDPDDLVRESNRLVKNVNALLRKLRTYSQMRIAKLAELNDAREQLSAVNELIKFNRAALLGRKKEFENASNIEWQKNVIRQQFRLEDDFRNLGAIKQTLDIKIKQITVDVAGIWKAKEALVEEIENRKSILKNSQMLKNIDDYVNRKSRYEATQILLHKRNDTQNAVIVKEAELKGLQLDIRRKRKGLNKRKLSLASEYNGRISEFLRQLNFNSNSTKLPFLKIQTVKGSGSSNSADYFVHYIAYFALLSEAFKNISLSMPFLIDSFIKNETSTNNIQGLFDILFEELTKYTGQSFVSLIQENLKYIPNYDEFNMVQIPVPIMDKKTYQELEQ
ncbi:hypothetical protein [Weissella cibaria]|uniref:hypothetical protein n=1 Tax=Weissella cibaria TaxID=137591 RepID=UPI001896E96D|nr:hypothetical protein [Weissella cibaria]